MYFPVRSGQQVSKLELTKSYKGVHKICEANSGMKMSSTNGIFQAFVPGRNRFELSILIDDEFLNL